jgi:hypothetical protein
MTPNQVADCMFVVGWLPPLGITVHSDLSVTVTDAAAKKACVRFLDVALAVCEAESGFNPKMKNAKSSASGLWQIMVSVHGPEIAAEIKRWEGELGKTGLTVFDPIVNTGVAREISNGGWGPWKETYASGKYKKFLGHGEKAYAYLTSKAHQRKDMNALVANLTSDAAYAQAATFLLPGSTLINGAPEWASSLLAMIAAWALPIGVFFLGVVLFVLGLWLIAGKPGGDLAKKLPGV